MKAVAARRAMRRRRERTRALLKFLTGNNKTNTLGATTGVNSVPTRWVLGRPRAYRGALSRQHRA